MKFTAIFAAVACAVAAQAATVQNLLSDISTISTGTTNIDSLVAAYPTTGGTLAGALAIHNAAAGLVAPINTATSDAGTITPLPIAVSDASSIIDALNLLRPPIIRHLRRLIILRSSFLSLPVGGVPQVILTDLNNLNTATIAFQNAVVANIPASLQAQASDFFTTVLGEFTSTIAAYS